MECMPALVNIAFVGRGEGRGGGGLCAERGQRCLFGREMEGKEAMRPIDSNRVMFLSFGVGFNERTQHTM